MVRWLLLFHDILNCEVEVLQISLSFSSLYLSNANIIYVQQKAGQVKKNFDFFPRFRCVFNVHFFIKRPFFKKKTSYRRCCCRKGKSVQFHARKNALDTYLYNTSLYIYDIPSRKSGQKLSQFFLLLCKTHTRAPSIQSSLHHYTPIFQQKYNIEQLDGVFLKFRNMSQSVLKRPAFWRVVQVKH